MRTTFACVLIYILQSITFAYASPEKSTDKVVTKLITIDAHNLDELRLAQKKLRQNVAYIVSTLIVPPDQPLLPDQADGFGIVLSNKHIACQAFIVKNASKIKIQGPIGQIEATVSNINIQQRIAILQTKTTLTAIGLHKRHKAPAKSRTLNMDLFALTSTEPQSSLLHGFLIDLGLSPHLEGNPRISLKLKFGMPVFDAQLRWVGLARTVAWDRDQQMIIPAEKVWKIFESVK